MNIEYSRRAGVIVGVQAHQRNASELDTELVPRPFEGPRFTEADRVAHTILVVALLAFAIGVALGRLGWPG